MGVFLILLGLVPGLVFIGIVIFSCVLVLLELARKPVSTRQNQAEGEMVILSKGRTHIRDMGPKDAPPIVLVHGLTTPSFVFDGLIEGLLEAGHRIIAYDHYGRGLSDRPRGLQSGAFFAGHLKEVMAHCGIAGPVKLAGYSMGGSIVTYVAAHHPEIVDELILIAPAGMRTNLGGVTGAAVRLPLAGDWLMHAFYPRQHMNGTEAERTLDIAVPNMIDRQQEELRYRGFIRSVLSSLRGVLRHPQGSEHQKIAKTDLKVTAIWGGEDEVIPLEGKDILSEWNPSVRHVVVGGAGHGVTYTHPQAVLTALGRV